MAQVAVTPKFFAPANVYIGKAKLSGGTVTVAFPQITDDSMLFVSPDGANVTGFLTTTHTSGTGFSITSSVGGDSGFVSYMICVFQQHA